MKESTFTLSRGARIGRFAYRMALQMLAIGIAGYLMNVLQVSSDAVKLYMSFTADPDGNTLMQATYLFLGAGVVVGFLSISYRIWMGRRPPLY